MLSYNDFYNENPTVVSVAMVWDRAMRGGKTHRIRTLANIWILVLKTKNAIF